MHKSIGFAEINDIKIYYETTGDGFPLVMLHAGLVDCRMWDGQFDFMGRHFRTIRYDARGFGQSGLPDHPYSPARDLLDLLNMLDIGKANLMGSSMGGGVALEFALEFPERVNALVLAGSSLVGFEYSTDFMKKGSEVLAVVKEHGVSHFLRYFFQDSFWSYSIPAHVYPEARQRFEELMRENAGMFEWYPNYIRSLDPPAITRLGEIEIPVLVMAGEEDHKDNLVAADILKEKIKHAEKVVIPEVGHMMNMEKPSEFNGRVLDFLTNIGY